MRRAQGLSINTIILAALGVIILAILAYMVFGAADSGTKSTKACSLQGGTCAVGYSPQCSGDDEEISGLCRNRDGDLGDEVACCKKRVTFFDN